MKSLAMTKRRGGIGKALGLANAKLGMTVEGDPNDTSAGPAPGSRAFGMRARGRMAFLAGKKRPKRHIFMERMDKNKIKDRLA